MNAETIQQKIQVARRDAESLKDRIKRKKDELADTTRKSLATSRPPPSLAPIEPLRSTSVARMQFANFPRSTRCREAARRGLASAHDEDEAHPEGASGQNLRDALVY